VRPEGVRCAASSSEAGRPRGGTRGKGDLHRMADWLVSCGVTTAAMESTGVYWIPVYDVLEQHGIKPCLVNPRNMKNVPGKRTDFHECQWIQHLHSMGLLHSAFRPDGP
jgi:transposase